MTALDRMAAAKADALAEDSEITTRYREARILAALLPSPQFLNEEGRAAVMHFVEAVQLAERTIHQRERPRPAPAKTSF